MCEIINNLHLNRMAKGSSVMRHMIKIMTALHERENTREKKCAK